MRIICIPPGEGLADERCSPLQGKMKKRCCICNTASVTISEAYRLDSPLNLVGTEASGTGVHMARSSVDNSLDPLHIGLPGTVGTSVRVGDLDTESHALATKITLRHSSHLLSIGYSFLRSWRTLKYNSKEHSKMQALFYIFFEILKIY